ncbi:hypothetical protein [Aquimarina sp. SS2-1]|uniref:hypothetical protein n=1 Tax=Aquimarina besae TaxID=3342247 RepID=UPI00366E4C07
MENIIHKIDQTLQSKLMSELVFEKLKRERSILAITIMNQKLGMSKKELKGAKLENYQ